jgi:sensor c-di-GMP phosphodiesterase-like protein
MSLPWTALRRWPWVAGARGEPAAPARADHAGDTDPRATAARLRPLAVVALAALIGTVLAALAAWHAWHGAARAADQRMLQVTEALSRSLAQAAGELDALQVEPEADCGDRLQHALTRAALDAVLVREFLFQPPGAVAACGALGPVRPPWAQASAAAVPAGRVQLLPVPGLRPAIALRQVLAAGTLVAVVDPRQLLDRVQAPVQGARPVLRMDDGRLLFAADGDASLAEGGPLQRRSQALAGWPMRVELTLPMASFTLQAAAAAPLLAALWLAATVLAVVGVNGLIAAYGSRRRRLHQALRKRRFVPVVQPVVDAATGKCVGAEVLMRWKHPTRGLVAPAEFIDYAERSGLIVPMSDLLMRTARDQLAEVALAHPEMYFSFNVAPAQLRRGDFAACMVQIFDGEPIGPQRVLIELTERELTDAQVRSELARLRALGFRIAVDDFGTGHSSLALLQNLPLDRLKIDREFVRAIETGGAEVPVLDAIVDLAHRLKLDLVAEGVETAAQRDYLRAHGVQALQGYLIARPLTPPDFAAWVERQAPAEGAASPAGDAAPAQPNLRGVLQKLRQARHLQRDRWYRLRLHRECLVGSELTHWMADRFYLTRKQAVRLGQRLVARGWVQHVEEEHDFDDGPLLYRVLGEATQEEPAEGRAAAQADPAQAMAWLRGPHGVRPGRRTAGLIEHRDAFSGREAVLALMRAGGLPREAALAAGRRLLRNGVLRHTFDERGFEDSPRQHYSFD